MTPILEMPDAELSAIVRRAAGAALRRLRVRAGFTQGDVAALLNSHRPIISRIEAGRHTPTLNVAARYARACGGGLGHVLLAIDQALGVLPRGTP